MNYTPVFIVTFADNAYVVHEQSGFSLTGIPSLTAADKFVVEAAKLDVDWQSMNDLADNLLVNSLVANLVSGKYH